MKKLIFLITSLLIFLSTFNNEVFAHEGARVEVELEGSSVLQAGDIAIDFQLIDEKNKTVLKDQDLSVVHEKILHVFIFDAALKEFRHEHPEFNNSKWQLSTHLPVNGTYWIWMQGKIASDGKEFSAEAKIKIKNGMTANPLPPVLGDVRSESDGISTVTLSNDNLIAKKMVMLTAKFSRTDGTNPELTPFLGELAHVITTSSDAQTLIHVHPMDHGTPNELMIHAVFPKAGEYRLWVQFIDANILRTIPLAVKVTAK